METGCAANLCVRSRAASERVKLSFSGLNELVSPYSEDLGSEFFQRIRQDNALHERVVRCLYRNVLSPFSSKKDESNRLTLLTGLDGQGRTRVYLMTGSDVLDIERYAEAELLSFKSIMTSVPLMFMKNEQAKKEQVEKMLEKARAKYLKRNTSRIQEHRLSGSIEQVYRACYPVFDRVMDASWVSMFKK